MVTLYSMVFIREVYGLPGQQRLLLMFLANSMLLPATVRQVMHHFQSPKCKSLTNHPQFTYTLPRGVHQGGGGPAAAPASGKAPDYLISKSVASNLDEVMFLLDGGDGGTSGTDGGTCGPVGGGDWKRKREVGMKRASQHKAGPGKCTKGADSRLEGGSSVAPGGEPAPANVANAPASSSAAATFADEGHGELQNDVLPCPCFMLSPALPICCAGAALPLSPSPLPSRVCLLQGTSYTSCRNGCIAQLVCISTNSAC